MPALSTAERIVTGKRPAGLQLAELEKWKPSPEVAGEGSQLIQRTDLAHESHEVDGWAQTPRALRRRRPKPIMPSPPRPAMAKDEGSGTTPLLGVTTVLADNVIEALRPT